MMKIAATLLVLCAACGGAPFTAADPFASTEIAVENDAGNPGSRVALADPPPAEDAGVGDRDTNPSNVVDDRDSGGADRPDAQPAAVAEAGPPSCVPVPYDMVCPAQASNWPLCGRHADGCGGVYDCGEPCPVPPDAGDAAPPTYVPPGACTQLNACSGCAVISTVLPNDTATCNAAITNSDATTCAHYLAIAKSDGILCND